MVKRARAEAGAFGAEANEGFTKGGAGAADLAEAVVDACEQPNEFRPLYDDDEPIQDKIEAVAKRVYGASDVYFYPEAEKKLTQFTADGLSSYPVCMAKTHLSLSADPRCSTHRSTSRSRSATSARTRARAGSCRCAATSRRCRGSGSRPAALNVDIDAAGRTVGLF